MKKAICMMLSLLLLCGLFAGCASAPQTGAGRSIVVTVFPIYDWVMNLLGDRAGEWNVTFLLDNGVDLHSYQPTADDMVKIASCDLFLYVGGESDKWVDDALKTTVNGDLRRVNLVELLGENAKEEELVEGMEGEEEEEEKEAEEGPEYDEHVWLSVRNAARFCEAINDQLCALDQANAAIYTANKTAYCEKLNALDAQYAETVESAKRNVVLFGDRFPFRYLVDDYGLAYYAAFLGCSAESEASFETVVFLAGKMDELGLDTVLTLESTDHKLAQTIIDNTADRTAQIVSMDSMQSTTRVDADNGASYLTIMEQNLDALRTALN